MVRSMFPVWEPVVAEATTARKRTASDLEIKFASIILGIQGGVNLGKMLVKMLTAEKYTFTEWFLPTLAVTEVFPVFFSDMIPCWISLLTVGAEPVVF